MIRRIIALIKVTIITLMILALIMDEGTALTTTQEVPGISVAAIIIEP